MGRLHLEAVAVSCLQYTKGKRAMNKGFEFAVSVRLRVAEIHFKLKEIT